LNLYLALGVVAVALLLIIILYMSYFTTLQNIANFAYPNAKLRAIGLPLVKEEVLEHMMESANLQQLEARLAEVGYKVPTQDRDSLDDALDSQLQGLLYSAQRTMPRSVQPFFGAYLLKFEIVQVKKMLRLLGTGQNPSSMRPFGALGQDRVAAIADSRGDIPKLASILVEMYPELEADSVKDLVELEMVLDNYYLATMKASLSRIAGEPARDLRLFLGQYIDIINIKNITRAKAMGLQPDRIKAMVHVPGYELSEWKLEQMADKTDMEALLKELEGSSYGAGLKAKEGLQVTSSELEKSLDLELLERARTAGSQKGLTVGPAVHYFMGKEFENRNLRVLVWSFVEGYPPKQARQLMVMEA